MKTSSLIAAMFLLISMNLFSQDTTQAEQSKWKTSGFAGLTLSQTAFSNWAKGGDNSYTANGLFNYTFNYIDTNWNWENTIELGYGVIQSEENGMKKMDDKIDANSKIGYAAFGKYFYTANMNFKTQFDDGFDFSKSDSIKVSDFFSPAYLNISLGLDYKPDDNYSVYFSPVSGRLIWVLDQELADKGAYGVKPAVRDTAGNIIEEGETFRAELGAYLTAQAQYELMENITAKSKIELFNNYTDSNEDNRFNIDVNWETSIIGKINSFLSANIFIHMIYDHDVDIQLDEFDSEGNRLTGQRLQIKEVFGIGISYKF
jgi:hypothetical protein